MFIAKNNDLIVLAKETKEELEFALQIMNYTSIEETDISYIFYNGKYITEEEKELIEQERIAQLNMTRGDFIEGLILALGKDENDVIALIETLPITDIEKKVYINRVKNALDFYRGYPVIDVLCEYLGLTTEQMTQFFETKDWKHLIPIPVEPEEPTDEPTESEIIDETENTEEILH